MGNTKKDYVNELIQVAFEYDKKYQLQEEKTNDFKRMAQLAREHKKDSQEFRKLDFKWQSTVIDFSSEAEKMKRVISNLKKYKITSL